MSDEDLVTRLERDEFDSGSQGAFAMAGALLKSQGAVIRDVHASQNLGRYLRGLFLVAVVFSAAYGAILGMFEPGRQTLYAALKMPIIVLGSALLCTPSFFVFNSILGSRLTFRQTTAIVLVFVASATLILVAFAPIAWLFTMTTNGPVFLRILHLAIFGMAIGFGGHVLGVTSRYLLCLNVGQPQVHPGFLRAWFVIALFVSLQMAWYFRPLVVSGPFHTRERSMFLEDLGSLLRKKAKTRS